METKALIISNKNKLIFEIDKFLQENNFSFDYTELKFSSIGLIIDFKEKKFNYISKKPESSENFYFYNFNEDLSQYKELIDFISKNSK
jgi:hypothetical protein